MWKPRKWGTPCMLIENSWNRVSCSGTLRTSIPSLICRHVWKVYEQAVNLKVCVYPLREKQLPVPQSLKVFLTFPACFLISMIFSNLNYNCSNLLDMRNLQLKKHSVTKNWHFTVWINCSSDLKTFSITRTFFSHSRSEQFC